MDKTNEIIKILKQRIEMCDYMSIKYAERKAELQKQLNEMVGRCK